MSRDRPQPSAGDVGGGAGTRMPVDFAVQFARVGTSDLGTTSATLYNVEGAGGQPSTGMDVYGQLGLVVRPPGPDQTGGFDRHAEVLCLRTSDGLVPIAGRDVRLNQFFPNPKPGDLALVGYGANFIKLGIDGRISIVTTKDGTPNGAMMQLQLRPDGFAILGDWGKISLDEGGMHVLTHTGARLDMGGIGGLPIDSLGSYASLAAAIAKLEASSIILGPVTGIPEFTVKSLRLEALLALISSAASADALALTAILADLKTRLGPPLPPTTEVAVGNAVAALNASATAINAALLPASPTSIQSTSTSVT